MSYVGSSAAVIPVGFSGVNSQSFNGDGSTVAFTLNRPVSAVNAIEVMVNNVQQSPYDGSYSVSSTTLTFSAAPSSGTANIYVVYRDFPVGSITDPNTYTKAQTDTLLDARVAKSGDTMTGNLIVNANVGIGTSSPNFPLSFGANLNKTIAVFENAGADVYGIGMGGNGSAGDPYRTKVFANGFEYLSVDYAGRVTMPYQPSFWAQVTANYTQGVVNGYGIGTSNGYGISVRHNTGNHYNSATGVFTAPVAGVYVFGIDDLYYSGTGYIQTGISVNGGAATAYKYTDSSGTVYDSAASTITVSLAANDTVGFFVTSNVANSYIHGGGYNNMFGYLLG